MADTRLKIAVFIDFDNIEIGVKSTLGVQFDIGVVLEALKERGDVVSKIAYGDWTRAGDYSRSLTQHATKLVQRNLTPGGDKNGADINLALDALEMAFTHGHINAYVIVGGDSDFITLVEKLKQYRQADLRRRRPRLHQHGDAAQLPRVHRLREPGELADAARRPIAGGRAGRSAQTSIEVAVPLVRRALKVLSDREVSPQLGLLKSTLLQLDSTFSERTYGAGSFRDFAQKLAVGRARRPARVGAERARGAGRGQRSARHGRSARAARTRPPQYHSRSTRSRSRDAKRRTLPQAAPADTASTNGGEPEPRTADGIREVRRLFQSAQNPPRWPMYIRQAKQFLRNVDASFDERKFGFASLVDLLRACQREGLFRIERDRQGVMRVFPGNIMQAAERTSEAVAGDDDNRGNVAEPTPIEDAADESPAVEWAASVSSIETEVVEGAVVQEMNAAPPVLDGEATLEDSDARTRTVDAGEGAQPWRPWSRQVGRCGQGRDPSRGPRAGASPQTARLRRRERRRRSPVRRARAAGRKPRRSNR